MIRQLMIGTIVTVNVTIKKNMKSCASSGDFSTYDAMIDSYQWLSYKECLYLVVPSSRKGNVITATVYLQSRNEISKMRQKQVTRSIIEHEFISKLCGVSVVRIGAPRLFLRPQVSDGYRRGDAESRSEKNMDMITHL